MINKKECLAWAAQIQELLNNPPIKDCAYMIINNSIVLYDKDEDLDLSYVSEDDPGVYAIVPLYMSGP